MQNRENLVSVVIRTYNEARYLDELLTAINNQQSDVFEVEIVIIDSGSTDKTLEIAKKHNARITHILKEDFTFGKSLNMGCEFADGEYLAFVSGHCIPTDISWLHNLVKPLSESIAEYTYGRQIGRDTTKFSERQLFEKYFPAESKIPQAGYFCNNANAAIKTSAWKKYKFDETLTGLEDMHTAQKIYADGGKIGYVANAVVYHIHDELWPQVRNRYEREAIALQKIMPEVHISVIDMLHFIIVAVIKDTKSAYRKKSLMQNLGSILMFRTLQYYGAYKGNHILRKLSKSAKMKYFYPRLDEKGITHE